jgi:hypothetical protein
MTNGTDNGPDFLSTADRLMAEGKLLGAIFRPDGSWTMDAGRAPLPVALTDRLRVHRAAIAAILAKG